jgi:hypothetical protein
MSTTSKTSKTSKNAAAAVAAAAAAPAPAPADVATTKPKTKRGTKRQVAEEGEVIAAAAPAAPAALEAVPEGKPKTKRVRKSAASDGAAAPDAAANPASAAAAGGGDPAPKPKGKRGPKAATAAAAATDGNGGAGAAAGTAAPAAPKAPRTKKANKEAAAGTTDGAPASAAVAAPTTTGKKKKPSHAATVTAAKGFFNYALSLPGKDTAATTDGTAIGTDAAASAAADAEAAAAAVEQFLGNIRSLAFNATAASVPAIVAVGKRAVQTLAKHKNERQVRPLDLEASVAAYTQRMATVEEDSWAATNGKWLTTFKLPRNITAQELTAPGFALTEEENQIFAVRCALVVFNIAVQKGYSPLGLASENGKFEKVDGVSQRILAHPVDGDRLYINRVHAYITYMNGTPQTAFAPVPTDSIKVERAKGTGDDAAADTNSLVSGVLSAAN